MNQAITMIVDFEMSEASKEQAQKLVEKIDAELKLQFGTTYKGHDELIQEFK